MDKSSGVGVLDKAVTLLDALQTGPANLAGLAATTGLPRPTAHRLATALEVHGLVGRDASGRFILGPRLAELASSAGEDQLLNAAGPLLTALRNITGESAQLYVRDGDQRICIAAAERTSGLRDTVPVGTSLPMSAGSAAQVLTAWQPADVIEQLLSSAKFSAHSLASVRRRGWAQSVGERESGVASVSAPVWGLDGNVIAAISVSGPIERLTRTPGRLHATSVVASAGRLSQALELGAATSATND